MAKKSATAEVDTPTDDVEVQAEQNYVALYRRFRPQRFEDVFGQESTTESLRQMVESGKIPHALMFVGERGTGKTTSARIFAKAVNCENIKRGEPCNECLSCQGVSEGSSSLGVIEIDAASNRSIDDIRRIADQASVASAMTKRKVFIIDEVHALTKDAITAFLKLLEEPPRGVIFILATTDPEKVLPTIRSRVVPFRFNLVQPKRMAKLIREVSDKAGIKISDKEITNVVREGKGSPRDTLSVLERFSAGGTAVVNEYSSPLTKALGHGRPDQVILLIADATSGSVDLKVIASDLIAYWRDCVLSIAAPNLLDVTDEEFDAIEADAKLIKLSRLYQLLTLMAETVGQMGYSGDPRTLFEARLLSFMIPAMEVKSMVAIQDQLDNIQKAIEALSTNRPITGGATTWPDVEQPPRRAKSDPQPDADDDPSDAEDEADEADVASDAAPEPAEPERDDTDDERKPKKDKKAKKDKAKKDKKGRDPEDEGPEEESDPEEEDDRPRRGRSADRDDEPDDDEDDAAEEDTDDGDDARDEDDEDREDSDDGDDDEEGERPAKGGKYDPVKEAKRILELIQENAGKRVALALSGATIVQDEFNDDEIVIQLTGTISDRVNSELKELGKEFGEGRKLYVYEADSSDD